MVYIILSILFSYPLSHLLMKKGMEMDFHVTLERVKELEKFFYIPIVNLMVSLFYLLWVIINFKRLD